MLDLELTSSVPAISVIRNSYQLLCGNTDLAALIGNIAVDSAGRYAAVGTAKMLGTSAVVILGLTGWPAILLPVFAATPVTAAAV